MTRHKHRARKGFGQPAFVSLAPTRNIGRHGTERKTNRSPPKAGIKSPSTVKAHVGIDFVEIMEYAADGGAFVIIERLPESGQDHAKAVDHQVLSYPPAGICEPI